MPPLPPGQVVIEWDDARAKIDRDIPEGTESLVDGPKAAESPTATSIATDTSGVAGEQVGEQTLFDLASDRANEPKHQPTALERRFGGNGDLAKASERQAERDRDGTRILRLALVVAIGMTLAFSAVIGRVVQLQAWPAERIADRSERRTSTTPLLARRANLLDRRLRPLALTSAAEVLFVDPKLIEDPSTFSATVGYNMGYDPAWIEKELHQRLSRRPESRWVKLDDRLSDERVAKLEGFDLAGLGTQRRLVRDYPQGSLAGQVIGFVGVEGKGLFGMERVLDSDLGGEAGQLTYLRDARSRSLWVRQEGYKPPRDGHAVRLSIDIVIQSIAEEQLAAACKQFRAPSGQMVIMDPYTGEILAMANYPFFNPSAINNADKQTLRNRCVTDMYEPGSTFKPFFWAAATEMGVARRGEKIDGEDGFWVSPKGRRLRDAHGHSMMTWEESLMFSSNIAMAKVGIRMGERRMYHAIRAFGFGQPTGSEMVGEVGGLVRPLKKWNHYSLTSVPMGQEVAVTPLQMVRAFCIIANGGMNVRPTILAKDELFADQPSSEPVLIHERVLSRDTADYTRHVLRRTVTEGTGRKANSDHYRLFGKTGTAQLPNAESGGYHQNRYVSSFMAGAPYEHPRMVVVCAIHDPDKSVGHYGGIVAAPPVMRVIEQSLSYLGVPPDRVESGAEGSGGTLARR